MIPQSQKVVDKGRGDCFRACMASILELPNDERLPDGYSNYLAWDAWLRKFGMSIGYHHRSIWREGYWIASVKSRNYSDGTTHAIVMRGTKVAFDPSTKKRYRQGLDLLSTDTVLGGYWIEVDDFSRVHEFCEYKKREGLVRVGKQSDSLDIRIRTGVVRTVS